MIIRHEKATDLQLNTYLSCYVYEKDGKMLTMQSQQNQAGVKFLDNSNNKLGFTEEERARKCSSFQGERWPADREENGKE